MTTVCLTFDFDALSIWVSTFKLITPTPLSRGEYGARVGLGRVLKVLERHAVPATFFVPAHTAASFPDAVRGIGAAGHEIAAHGFVHESPVALTRAEEVELLARSEDVLARVTGEKPSGYRSPAWDLSPHSVDLLLNHDFVYDSSMMGNDYTPYRVRRGDVIELEKPAVFGEETRLVEMPISWTLDDYPHFEFIRTPTWILPGNMNANLVLQNWIEDFGYLSENLDWGVITYTFHPFVIGRGHRMVILEKLIQTLAERGAVFMTVEDAVTEFLAR